MNKKVTLQSPWDTLAAEFEALFGEDPEVKVVYDRENLEVKLLVENAIKADALTKLLPSERNFGNVTLYITVVPADDPDVDRTALFKNAFTGNPAFEKIVKASGKGLYNFNYVVLRKRVVQFFNDDLTDVNGNRSCLYQDLATDIFGESDEVFFCTSDEDPVF